MRGYANSSLACARLRRADRHCPTNRIAFRSAEESNRLIPVALHVRQLWRASAFDINDRQESTRSGRSFS